MAARDSGQLPRCRGAQVVLLLKERPFQFIPLVMDLGLDQEGACECVALPPL